MATPITRHIDLDDQQRLEHELHQVAPVSAEERLRPIIEAEPECVKLLDKDGPGTIFVQQPYTAEILARKVREALSE